MTLLALCVIAKVDQSSTTYRNMVSCSTADDNMIVKRDTDHLAGFDESFRLQQIFIAWHGIATWMCVSDDYGCCSKAYRMAEYVAGMKRRCVEDTPKHKQRFAQKPSLRVEIERKCIFLLFVNTGGQDLSHNVIGSFHCTFE